ELGDDPLAPAVGGNERDVEALGVGDVAPLARHLRQPDLAGDGVLRAAGDHIGKLHAPRAGGAGDPEDLPAVDFEVDAAQPPAVDGARLEDDGGVGTRRHGRAVVRIDLLADHETRQASRVDVVDRMRGDDAAPAKDGDAV